MANGRWASEIGPLKTLVDHGVQRGAHLVLLAQKATGDQAPRRGFRRDPGLHLPHKRGRSSPSRLRSPRPTRAAPYRPRAMPKVLANPSTDLGIINSAIHKVVANTSISGPEIISRPVPHNTTTCIYRSASVRNTLQYITWWHHVSCRATVATGSASGFYPRTACRKSRGVAQFETGY